MALQRDLDSLADWEQRRKMSFHLQNCTAMNITKRRTALPSQYQLHGHTLATDMEAKYLGVQITADLRWDAHITDICNKANKTLGFLRRNIKTTDERLKKCSIQSIRTTLNRVCQPCLGFLHSQQYQGTIKGSEAGNKMGEKGLQKISVCGHHARTTASANTRTTEKASTPHYLLQVPPRPQPHRVKTLPITNRPP